MWLAEMPSAMVQACLVMLPRLEAEEAIARVNEQALSAGHLAPEAARRLQATWAASAVPPDLGKRRGDPSVLTTMGIAVRRVPKRRAPA